MKITYNLKLELLKKQHHSIILLILLEAC